MNFNHDDSQSANNPYDKFSPKVRKSNYNSIIVKTKMIARRTGGSVLRQLLVVFLSNYQNNETREKMGLLSRRLLDVSYLH
jgi:hypothetical protein